VIVSFASGIAWLLFIGLGKSAYKKYI